MDSSLKPRDCCYRTKAVNDWKYFLSLCTSSEIIWRDPGDAFFGGRGVYFCDSDTPLIRFQAMREYTYIHTYTGAYIHIKAYIITHSYWAGWCGSDAVNLQTIPEFGKNPSRVTSIPRWNFCVSTDSVHEIPGWYCETGHNHYIPHIYLPIVNYNFSISVDTVHNL
jgi:hypothetical protein